MDSDRKRQNESQENIGVSSRTSALPQPCETPAERITTRFSIVEARDTDDAPNSQGSIRRRRRNTPLWMRKVAEFRPSLLLENSGSVARDHLALERTFLAYVRTSLGLAAMGVTLVQLLALTPTDIPGSLERMGKIIGAVIVLLGAMVMIIAVIRYFGTQGMLIEGKFKPAGVVVCVISAAIGIMILLISGLVFGIAFG